MSEFVGFPAELPEFLFGLQFENTIEKLPENKLRYQQLISEPLNALYGALLPYIEAMGGFETSRRRCVSSMYADRRFSRAPLREYCYLRFKTAGKETDIPGFYFDMGCAMYSFGIRIYNFTPDGLRALHGHAAANPGACDAALGAALAGGFSLAGADYKKDRFPTLPESPAKSLLRKKTFQLAKEEPVTGIPFSGRLAVELRQGFIQLEPTMELLGKALKTSENNQRL
ncbi:MAG: DUF2461 family protein [Clostridia bacterium]|nr:DUF2461 family protein [Clostridia bacterium]